MNRKFSKKRSIERKGSRTLQLLESMVPIIRAGSIRRAFFTQTGGDIQDTTVRSTSCFFSDHHLLADQHVFSTVPIYIYTCVCCDRGRSSPNKMLGDTFSFELYTTTSPANIIVPTAAKHYTELSVRIRNLAGPGSAKSASPGEHPSLTLATPLQ